MAKSFDVLTGLKAKRAENIAIMLSWSKDDFNDLLNSYDMAEEIALSGKDLKSLAILNEKKSQLSEAATLSKSHSRNKRTKQTNLESTL